MESVTQQNAALVEEAAAAAQSLEQQAVTLDEAASAFQVGSTTGAALRSAASRAVNREPALAAGRAVSPGWTAL